MNYDLFLPQFSQYNITHIINDLTNITIKNKAKPCLYATFFYYLCMKIREGECFIL